MSDFCKFAICQKVVFCTICPLSPGLLSGHGREAGVGGGKDDAGLAGLLDAGLDPFPCHTPQTADQALHQGSGPAVPPRTLLAGGEDRGGGGGGLQQQEQLQLEQSAQDCSCCSFYLRECIDPREAASCTGGRAGCSSPAVAIQAFQTFAQSKLFQIKFGTGD